MLCSASFSPVILKLRGRERMIFIQNSALRKIFAPGEEENLDVEEELDTATGTGLTPSFTTRVPGNEVTP